jgi:MerR family transcriptional regulator, copper efflux regulator
MRIGELAARTGLSTKTIRYYEGVGLLPPPARTSAGYRDYDKQAAKRLSFIRAGQSISLSLGEIREILALRDRGEAPCNHVMALIEQHAADLASRIDALEKMRSDLEQLARKARGSAREGGQSGFCHIIEGG